MIRILVLALAATILAPSAYAEEPVVHTRAMFIDDDGTITELDDSDDIGAHAAMAWSHDGDDFDFSGPHIEMLASPDAEVTSFETTLDGDTIVELLHDTIGGLVDDAHIEMIIDTLGDIELPIDAHIEVIVVDHEVEE
jgi:hypothetical protein